MPVALGWKDAWWPADGLPLHTTGHLVSTMYVGIHVNTAPKGAGRGGEIICMYFAAHWQEGKGRGGERELLGGQLSNCLYKVSHLDQHCISVSI